MSPTPNRELFPGLFDPEGAPWSLARGDRGVSPDYLRSVRLTLKTLFLTQERFFLPPGYLFDNPGLQQVMAGAAGAELEALLDLIGARVHIFSLTSVDTAAHSGRLDTEEKWRAEVFAWLVGKDGWRASKVVPSSLSFAAFTELRCAPENVAVDTYFRLSEAELSAVWANHLEKLARAAPRGVKVTGPFRFSALLRSEAARDDPEFPAIRAPVREKVLAIGEAADEAGIPISRSLLQDAERCLEIRVPQEMIVRPHEYSGGLLAACRHYHQLSFAELCGSGVVCGEQPPGHRIAAPSAALLARAEEIFADQKYDGGLARVLPSFTALDAVKWTDIRRLVMDSERFNLSLNALRDTRGDEEAHAAALRDHWGQVKRAIWGNAGIAAAESLGQALRNTSLTIGARPGARVSLMVLMNVVGLGAPLIFAALKHRELTALLRSIEGNVPRSAETEQR